MEALKLYDHLDRDFILPGLSDDWSELARPPYTENFRRRFMGLALDNAREINRIYTAVFPSPKVLRRLYETDVTDALLFTHHPMVWRMPQIPVFTPIPEDGLAELRRRRISLYILHVPLDRDGPYSTSVNLAARFGGEIDGEFYPYYGAMVGVTARTPYTTVAALRARFDEVTGISTKLYPYGDESISGGVVGFCGGGGNVTEVYEELAAQGVTVYVTGIGNMETGHPPAVRAHETAKARRISVLTGSHYATEQFACRKMTEYFEKLGLPAEFIADEACLADL